MASMAFLTAFFSWSIGLVAAGARFGASLPGGDVVGVESVLVWVSLMKQPPGML
jgi:hypothetical protein